MTSIRRRSFLKASASVALSGTTSFGAAQSVEGLPGLSGAGAKPAPSGLDSYEIAMKHPIESNKPAVNFFEGALLGNGGLGCVVTTRPDAVVIHFGHNEVWDIRIAEDHGLHSPPSEYEIAANSYRNHLNEGGNDLVFYNLQGARLGLLDLERFKRQVLYCLLPNGTCTDLALQSKGRYSDTTPFDFMARMGIWFENFSLPVVINECLLQGYSGTLRFFPNWPKEKRAEFHTLRAAGAFLVSALFDRGETQWIEIQSEAGAPLRLIIPWKSGAAIESSKGRKLKQTGIFQTETAAGEVFRLIALRR